MTARVPFFDACDAFEISSPSTTNTIEPGMSM